MGDLIPNYELESTTRFRATANADDILRILHHYWTQCDDWYSSERQRVQHAIMIVFCASTTARAGTVIESSGYYGTNDALQYSDIELRALRGPDGIQLGMHIQLRLLKGRRNYGNP